MESLLKNLRKHVECSICLDTFTEPKTIACLHTFCCEWLKRHAVASQRNGQFRCPECRHRLMSPKETNLISCRPVFITIACSVFSLSNRVPMEVRSAVGFARKRALKSVTASIARSCCAVTALTPTKYSEMLRSMDTR